MTSGKNSPTTSGKGLSNSQKMSTGRPLGLAHASTTLPTSQLTSNTTTSTTAGVVGLSNYSSSPSSSSLLVDEVKLMMYMGIDCVLEVFSVHPTRTRDFCSMFYKLGLLKHLSVAFQRIFELSKSPHASTTCGAPTKFAMYNRKTSQANSLAGSTIDGSMHSGNADSSVNGANSVQGNNSIHGGGGGNTGGSVPGSGVMKAPLSLSSTLSLGPNSGSK